MKDANTVNYFLILKFLFAIISEPVEIKVIAKFG